MQLLPAILAPTVSQVHHQIKQINGASVILHLDVEDNHLVKGKTPADVAAMMLPGHTYDLHLMVNNPLIYLKGVNVSMLRYCYAHLEAKGFESFLDVLNRHGIKAGAALSPKSKVDDLEPYQSLIKSVLVMTVEPGASGRPFQPKLAKKVALVKQLYPNLYVAVDGGMTEQTLPLVSMADSGMVHSAVFKAKNPAAELKRLQQLFQ